MIKNCFLYDSRIYRLEYQPFQTNCEINVMAYQVEASHIALAKDKMNEMRNSYFGKAVFCFGASVDQTYL